MKTMIFILWAVAGYLIPIEEIQKVHLSLMQTMRLWERSISNDRDNFDIWKVVAFKVQLLQYFREESKSEEKNYIFCHIESDVS